MRADSQNLPFPLPLSSFVSPSPQWCSTSASCGAAPSLVFGGSGGGTEETSGEQGMSSQLYNRSRLLATTSSWLSLFACKAISIPHLGRLQGRVSLVLRSDATFFLFFPLQRRLRSRFGSSSRCYHRTSRGGACAPCSYLGCALPEEEARLDGEGDVGFERGRGRSRVRGTESREDAREELGDLEVNLGLCILL